MMQNFNQKRNIFIRILIFSFIFYSSNFTSSPLVADGMESEDTEKIQLFNPPKTPLPALSQGSSTNAINPNPVVGSTSLDDFHLQSPYFSDGNDPIRPFIFDIQTALTKNDTKTITRIFAQIDLILEAYPELWPKYRNLFIFLIKHFKIPLAFAEKREAESRKLERFRYFGQSSG